MAFAATTVTEAVPTPFGKPLLLAEVAVLTRTPLVVPTFHFTMKVVELPGARSGPMQTTSCEEEPANVTSAPLTAVTGGLTVMVVAESTPVTVTVAGVPPATEMIWPTTKFALLTTPTKVVVVRISPWPKHVAEEPRET